jgi:hypothetical protein
MRRISVNLLVAKLDRQTGYTLFSFAFNYESIISNVKTRSGYSQDSGKGEVLEIDIINF